MSDRAHSDSALVQFSERLTNSAAFGNLFREGMDLDAATAEVMAQIVDQTLVQAYPGDPRPN